jgi:hypothetical protein
MPMFGFSRHLPEISRFNSPDPSPQNVAASAAAPRQMRGKPATPDTADRQPKIPPR